jgi:adenylate cyclase
MRWRTRRALGLGVERGQAIYTSALDDHARRLRTALDAGMPLEALLTINRVIGRAMAAVASASRDAMQALLADTDDDESARALRAAEAAEALVPELGKVLAYAFGEHVRELVRLEAGAHLVDLGAADVREVGIAFADLVGFTSLGDRLTPRELGRVAERLESLAFDALRPGVAVVKTIGDEVMLAASDVPALVSSSPAGSRRSRTPAPCRPTGRSAPRRRRWRRGAPPWPDRSAATSGRSACTRPARASLRTPADRNVA